MPAPAPASRQPLVARRDVLALAIGGLAFTALWQVTAPPGNLLFSDFLQAYYEAGSRLLRDGFVPTWPIYETCTEGFVNIPVLGWIFAPLAALESQTAALVFFGAGLLSMLASFRLVVRHFHIERSVVPLLVVLFLANGPLLHSLREGNLTHVLLVAIIAGYVLWREQWDLCCGLVFGACIVLKPPLALLAVYFAVRRQWRVVAGIVAVAAGVGLASLLLFGSLINVAWYSYCVSPFLDGLMPGFNVQSLETFLYRLANGDQHLHTWVLLPTPTAIRIARVAVTLALAGGALWLLAVPLRQSAHAGKPLPTDDRRLVEFNLVLATAVVASPLSWSHYYLWLLLPWSLHVAGRLPTAGDAIAAWLMRGGMVLASLPVLMLPTDLGPLAPLLSRTFVSETFIGGVLTVAALVRCTWLAARGEAARNGSRAGITMAAWVPAVGRVLRPRGFADLPPTARATRLLLLVLLLNAGLLSAVLWSLAPAGYDDVTLRHTLDLWRLRSDDDSWGPMAHALHYFENEYDPLGGSRPLYSELVFQWGDKFQYPPFTLFIASALRAVNAAVAPFFSATTAISAGLVVLSAMACAAILEIRFRQLDRTAAYDHLTGFRLGLAVALALTFYPVVKAFTLGQIQAWINTLFAFVVLLWLLQQKVPAGLLIGACALVKPHYALLLVWALARREWSFALAGTAVVLAGTGFAVLALGLEHHRDYVDLLTYLSRHGEAFYPNQSVNGLLNRVMSLVDPTAYNNLKWSDATFPPYTWWIHAATVTTSLAILGSVMLRRRGTNDRNGVLDLAAMALACTVASPIAWEPHYGILAPIYALLAASMLRERKLLPWLIASYVLTSTFIPATNLLAATPLNVLQSYLFAGALMALWILQRLRRPGAPSG